MENEEIQTMQTPSIKLIRNTKGYNFEIKILSLDVAELDKVRNEITAKIAKWSKEEAN